MKEIGEHAKSASEMLKAISHEDRLIILCLLNQKEMTVGELLEHTNLSQSAFSQHLKVLREKSLVKTRKQSQTVYYSIKNHDVNRILESIYQIYCKQGEAR
ncbi:ArsR/SmtB family transcription factor [Francisella frigiditurris]|uniref:Bacterial regulatory, arsR family protein n=1 Tax=Francisella frigiditurris TaxID=1542390 RepID=A0A1J0KW58_9GAMM|nr:metalloregulator ArsR/SmtB family transcription factor [Francisella frigiditurris]APC97914.1 bacterial regulatory, arsR family protein [Francisella frigiditurris]